MLGVAACFDEWDRLIKDGGGFFTLFDLEKVSNADKDDVQSLCFVGNQSMSISKK